MEPRDSNTDRLLLIILVALVLMVVVLGSIEIIWAPMSLAFRDWVHDLAVVAVAVALAIGGVKLNRRG